MLKVKNSSTKKPALTLAPTPTPAAERPRPPSQVVDDYAEVAASISILESRKKELQKEISAFHEKELKGTLHRVVVSSRPGRETFDTKAAISAGLLTQEQAAKFTKVGQPYDAILVYGLK